MNSCLRIEDSQVDYLTTATPCGLGACQAQILGMEAPEALLPAAGLEVLQHHGFEQPAGLEVGHPPSQQQPIYDTQGVDPSNVPSPGLEVAYPKSAQQQIYEFSTSDAPGVDQDEKASGVGGEPFFQKVQICGLRRQDFWLALTIILLAVLAVVLGAVLGTRKHDSSSASPSATVTATATATVTTISPDLPTSTSTPTSISANSRLAVTGWRTGQEYSIRLFYQGPDDYLRYSAYESTSGEWAAPVMSVKATARSPIGATAFNHSIYGGDDNMQTQLYYLDSSNYIREQDFYPGTTGNGSLSQENYKASPSSGLSTYWPSLIYEDDSSEFHEVTYAGSITANVWNAEAFSQPDEGDSESGLAELATTLNYTSLTLFYQTASGKLVQRSRDSGSAIWSAGVVLATIPKGSAIGALSVPTSTGTDASIYVLWQDTTGDIQVNWLSNSSSGWVGPSTYSALKNADNGTSITCLTPVTWYNVSMGTGPSLGRCYFQVNSRVREVEVDGGEWKVLGYLPMP